MVVDIDQAGQYVIRVYTVRRAEPVPARHGGETLVPVEPGSTFLNGRWVELYLPSRSGSDRRSVVLTVDDQPLPAWMKTLTRFEDHP